MGNVDETHQLVVSGSTAAWKLLSTPGDTPGARVYHTMAALGDGTAVVFGGLVMSTSTPSSDVYQLVVSPTDASGATVSGAVHAVLAFFLIMAFCT